MSDPEVEQQKKQGELQMYECHNDACTLGTAGNPGRFTGGIEKEQVTLLTGNQEPDDGTYGEGFCPNCGQEGEKV